MASLMHTEVGTSSTNIISYTARRRMERSTMGMRCTDQFSAVAEISLSMVAIWDSTPRTSCLA